MTQDIPKPAKQEIVSTEPMDLNKGVHPKEIEPCEYPKISIRR